MTPELVKFPVVRMVTGEFAALRVKFTVMLVGILTVV
jgi:hypothetical protein